MRLVTWPVKGTFQGFTFNWRACSAPLYLFAYIVYRVVQLVTWFVPIELPPIVPLFVMPALLYLLACTGFCVGRPPPMRLVTCVARQRNSLRLYLYLSCLPYTCRACSVLYNTLAWVVL